MLTFVFTIENLLFRGCIFSNTVAHDGKQAKNTGGKPVKSFHTHIAKHLGNETSASVAKHFNAFTSSMANLVNTIKTNVKVEAKNQTAQHGSVTHHLRESDPFMKKSAKGTKEKTKVTSIHKALNTTEMSKHAKAVGNHFKSVISSVQGTLLSLAFNVVADTRVPYLVVLVVKHLNYPESETMPLFVAFCSSS